MGLQIDNQQEMRAIEVDTTPGGATNTYVRPDGLSTYRRPGGTSLYVRP